MYSKYYTLRDRSFGGERGSALAESVIVLGLLALIVFGVIQYAADEHAEQAAQAAAEQLLAGLTGAIHDTTVSVDRSATQVTVHVTGHVDTLLGLTQTITASSAGPVEKFEPNLLEFSNPDARRFPSAPAGSPT
jgi:VCBS repeat-containing protein